MAIEITYDVQLTIDNTQLFIIFCVVKRHASDRTTRFTLVAVYVSGFCTQHARAPCGARCGIPCTFFLPKPVLS
ncbi:MAG: hypothetical protein AUK21_02960 [Parcubacteria group bacterium CG2_30_48_51]|nr:MAG: hypothetical protein AUK21_02960 [Parcubacteria group bacterium CG2_30_48_51]